MSQSFPSINKVRWFILRSVEEIWNSKTEIILLTLNIRTFHGSFTSFCSDVIQGQRAPLLLLWKREPLILSVPLCIQFLAILSMWKLFRRRQSKLLSTFRDINLDYFVQFLPRWSALRLVHFLMISLTPEQRSVSFFNELCHLKYILVSTHFGAQLWRTVRIGGFERLFIEIYVLIQIDFACLIIQQAQAAFTEHRDGPIPVLDYRHKPRFACAALLQASALLSLVVISKSFSSGLGMLFHILPVTSVATLLVYAINAHKSDYLNACVSSRVSLEYRESMFCQTCRATAIPDLGTSHERCGRHQMTTADVRRSAQDGCRICVILWIRMSEIEKDFVKSLRYWEPTTTYRRSHNYLVFSFKQDLAHIRRCQFRIIQAKEVGSEGNEQRTQPASHRLFLSQLSCHTGCEDSLKIAARWLRNCSIHHGTCNEKRVVTFRPSRLLCLKDDKIAIHNTALMPKKIYYFTLSHCWGNAQLIQLVRSNHNALRAHVPWDDLPKTFQNAITLTRRLGFSYLWIDSLCIVQDDPEDWDRESKLMGDIYKNAVCNIAASDASDSSHGCFYARDPLTLQVSTLPSGSSEEEYLVNDTDESHDGNILYTRAWVLQEALLARRTLDCGREQLFWRCGEVRASELFPGGLPRSMSRDGHPASKFETSTSDGYSLILDVNIIEARLGSEAARSQLPVTSSKGSVLPRSHDSAFGLWAAIVGYYTGMKLSKDTDRTVALSGIIDTFHPFVGAHFYGLWYAFMPLELLWASNGHTIRPSTRRVPTWSWMSLEGPVTYDNCTFQYGSDAMITKFVGIETIQDETQLRVETRLLRMTWKADGAQKEKRAGVISSIEGMIQLVVLMGIRITTESYGGVLFDCWNKEMPLTDVFCMPIRREKSTYARLFGEISGLVLHEVRPGVFERLGIFKAFAPALKPTKSGMSFIKEAQRREIVII